MIIANKLKKKVRNIFLLIVIIVNLISFHVELMQYTPTISNNIADNKHQDPQGLKSSGYWNLTNSYIYIDDSGNISITDPSLNLKWYTLNDGNITHIFSNSTGAINQSAWEDVLEGDVKITFYTNDLVGLSSFEVLTLNKDTVPPIINIISPIAGQTFNSTPPHFLLTIIDLHRFNISYTVNNQAPDEWGILFSELGNYTHYYFQFNLTSQFWESLPNGEIIVRFHAVDRVGNEVFKEIIIFKNIPSQPLDNSPPSISGFPIFLLIAFMGLASIFYYRSKKY